MTVGGGFMHARPDEPTDPGTVTRPRVADKMELLKEAGRRIPNPSARDLERARHDFLCQLREGETTRLARLHPLRSARLRD